MKQKKSLFRDFFNFLKLKSSFEVGKNYFFSLNLIEDEVFIDLDVLFGNTYFQ